jgi:aryl-alcohol dehydrogenase-like predicted oxidoreductase
MNYRKFANTGEKLSIIGLGCMGMSYAYGQPDDDESIATLHRALDLGINFWDTADVYGPHTNEELISKVLVPNRDKVFIATKFGFRRPDDGSYNFIFDGSPAYMRKAVEGSLKRLKVEVIDLYYAHRVDRNVPIEETVGAMAELVKEGKVKYLGLSEASPASIRKAHAVHPISALQSEYSLLTRGPENEILPLCEELGITFVPYSPLARGIFTNQDYLSDNLAADDYRRVLPQFKEDEYKENNRQLVKAFRELAESKNCSPSQLALAWVIAQGENIIPIPGTKRRKYLEENAKAVEIQLSKIDLEEIEGILVKYPNVGERYTEGALKLVNN